MVEFQEMEIKLNHLKDCRNQINFIRINNNLVAFSGRYSNLIIIVTLEYNNKYYVVSYCFKEPTYYTFFNKELRKLRNLLI